jgi:hypothetical protein
LQTNHSQRTANSRWPWTTTARKSAHLTPPACAKQAVQSAIPPGSYTRLPGSPFGNPPDWSGSNCMQKACDCDDPGALARISCPSRLPCGLPKQAKGGTGWSHGSLIPCDRQEHPNVRVADTLLAGGTPLYRSARGTLAPSQMIARSTAGHQAGQFSPTP